MKRVFFLFLFFLLSTSVVLGEDALVTDLQQKINEYTQKLVDLGSAKKTLKNEIAYITSQVELTLLQISQTENSIKILQQEIAELSLKINQLDIDLNLLSSAFIQQIVENYKLNKKAPPFFTLFFGNFNQFLQQQKYLVTVQNNSRNTLVDMETVRTNYDLQKQKKAQKQKEMEALEKQLLSQKSALAGQKESKSNLLAITQNDEVRYQKLKNEAESELSSLIRARFDKKIEVRKGQIIGFMGNTGFSYGAHLHFGLYNLLESDVSKWSYYDDIDASTYLSQNIWPMKNYRITQHRGGIGQAEWAHIYSDKFHHGIDMVSNDSLIYAINDGVAYYYKDQYPGQTIGSGNHVKLFHPDGKMTLYLHMKE